MLLGSRGGNSGKQRGLVDGDMGKATRVNEANRARRLEFSLCPNLVGAKVGASVSSLKPLVSLDLVAIYSDSYFFSQN